MVAILIHPLDLGNLLDAYLDGSPPTGDGPPPIDDLIEVGGKLYYQTTRVPTLLPLEEYGD